MAILRRPDPLQGIDKSNHDCCDKNPAQKGMRETAMVIKAKRTPAKPSQHIKVGRFRRQRQGQRGISGFAVESCAAEIGAKK